VRLEGQAWSQRLRKPEGREDVTARLVSMILSKITTEDSPRMSQWCQWTYGSVGREMVVSEVQSYVGVVTGVVVDEDTFLGM
jgi:hypothetical protein